MKIRRVITLLLFMLGMSVNLARGQTTSDTKNTIEQKYETITPENPTVSNQSVSPGYYNEMNQKVLYSSITDTSGEFVYTNKYLACYETKKGMNVYTMDMDIGLQIANEYNTDITVSKAGLYTIPLSRDSLSSLVRQSQTWLKPAVQSTQ